MIQRGFGYYTQEWKQSVGYKTVLIVIKVIVYEGLDQSGSCAVGEK